MQNAVAVEHFQFAVVHAHRNGNFENRFGMAQSLEGLGMNFGVAGGIIEIAQRVGEQVGFAFARVVLAHREGGGGW